MEVLRKDLAQLCSDPPCEDLDSTLCRNYGLRSLLYMQRDRARSNITDLCGNVVKRIQELQTELTFEVNKIATEKVALLFEQKDRIAKLKACLVAEVHAVRELLQVGNEDILAERGENKLAQLRQLLKDCNELDKEDNGFHLQFRPSGLLQSLMDATSVGHIQCSVLDVELVKLPAMETCCCYVAPINVEQRVLIEASLPLDATSRSYLRVNLKDPSGSAVECHLEDKEEGFVLHFQLHTDGFHQLEVRVYDVHIQGSPFLIEGEDGSCRISSSSSGSTEGRPGILKNMGCPSISRKSLAAVNKILMESSHSVTKYRNKNHSILSPTGSDLVRCNRRGSFGVRSEGHGSSDEEDGKDSASKRRKFIRSEEAKNVAFFTPDTPRKHSPRNSKAAVAKVVSADLFNDKLMVMVEGGERKTVFKPAVDLRELINAIKKTKSSTAEAFSVREDVKSSHSDDGLEDIIDQVKSVKIASGVSASDLQNTCASIVSHKLRPSVMMPLTVNTGDAAVHEADSPSPSGVDGWQKGRRRYGAGRGRGRVLKSVLLPQNLSRLKSPCPALPMAGEPRPGILDVKKDWVMSLENGGVKSCLLGPGGEAPSKNSAHQGVRTYSVGTMDAFVDASCSSAQNEPSSGSQRSALSPFQSPILAASKLDQVLKARNLQTRDEGMNKSTPNASGGNLCSVVSPWSHPKFGSRSSTPELKGSGTNKSSASTMSSVKRSFSDATQSRNPSSGRTTPPGRRWDFIDREREASGPQRKQWSSTNTQAAGGKTGGGRWDFIDEERRESRRNSMENDLSNVDNFSKHQDEKNAENKLTSNNSFGTKDNVTTTNLSSEDPAVTLKDHEAVKSNGAGKGQNMGSKVSSNDINVPLEARQAGHGGLNVAESNIETVKQCQRQTPDISSSSVVGYQGHNTSGEQGQKVGTGQGAEGQSLRKTLHSPSHGASFMASDTEGLGEELTKSTKAISNSDISSAAREANISLSTNRKVPLPSKSADINAESSRKNVSYLRYSTADDSGWEDAFDTSSSTTSTSSSHQRLSSSSSRGSMPSDLNTPIPGKPPTTPDVFSPLKHNSTETRFGNSPNNTPLKSNKFVSPSFNKEDKENIEQKGKSPSSSLGQSGKNSSGFADSFVSSGRRRGSSSPVSTSMVTSPRLPVTSGCWKDGALKNMSNIQMKFLGYVGKDAVQYPLGVAANKQHICVCHNNFVWMFDWTGKFAYKLSGGPPFNRPSAVVFNRKDEIFVKDSVQIHKYSAQGEFMIAFGKEYLRHPYGLSLLDDGHLLLLDTTKPSILQFEQTGRLASETPFTATGDQKRNSKCRFLATHQQTLVVTDLGLNKVFFTQFDSTLLCKLSSFGFQPGQLNEPSGIAVDSQGHCFVADSKNNRIQVFTLNADFSTVLPLPRPIARPSDIHLTPDGILLVSNLLGHSVSVFQFI